MQRMPGAFKTALASALLRLMLCANASTKGARSVRGTRRSLSSTKEEHVVLERREQVPGPAPVLLRVTTQNNGSHFGSAFRLY